MSSAYREGRRDGLDGFHENPYELGSDEYEDYEAGYDDGAFDGDSEFGEDD